MEGKHGDHHNQSPIELRRDFKCDYWFKYNVSKK